MPALLISIDSLPIESANELCRRLAAAGARADREATDTRKYGDATLLNVLTTLAPGVLAIVAGFMMKGTAGRKSQASYKFRRIEADGSSTEYEINITEMERKSKELSAASLKQLADLTGLTLDQIKDMVVGAGK